MDIELEVRSLLDDLFEGSVQGHPLLASIHKLAAFESQRRDELRDLALPGGLSEATLAFDYTVAICLPAFGPVFFFYEPGLRVPLYSYFRPFSAHG